jgi:chromosome segregation ATPase
METVKKRFEYKYSSRLEPLLEMLVEVSESAAFADQGTLSLVLQMIEELETDLQSSHAEADLAEASGQDTYDVYSAQLDAAYAELTEESAAVAREIASIDDEVAAKSASNETDDRRVAEFTQDLALIVERCQKLSSDYQEETTRRLEEQATCLDVRGLFLDLSSNMSEYLKGRVDEGLTL